MDGTRDFTELLEKQLKLQKRQSFCTGVAAVCCAALLALSLLLVPKVLTVMDSMEEVMGNLETITSELSDADIAGMVRDLDALATGTESQLSEAMEKLNSIDFETLNKAIANLSDAVEPMARFFNIFG